MISGGCHANDFRGKNDETGNCFGEVARNAAKARKNTPPPLPSPLFTAPPRPRCLSFPYCFGRQRTSLRRTQESQERTPLNRKFLGQVASGRPGLVRTGSGRVGSGRVVDYVFSKLKLRTRFAPIIVVVFCVSSLGFRPSSARTTTKFAKKNGKFSILRGQNRPQKLTGQKAR